MSLKTPLFAVLALGAVLVAPAAAQAGRSWVAPSTTVLSGPNAWITVDAATSDDLFFPNQRPLPITSITVLDADGQPIQPTSPSMGKFRSTFDVQVTKPGTWKIASVTTNVMASWTENGEVKRFRGSGEDFAKQVPAGATDLKTIRMVSRSETLVTRDKPTDAALKPSGQGLELQAVTHPSDVVATEPATFKLLIDGQPAAGLEVTLMRGYDRWSAKGSAETVVKTGTDGAFKITLPQAGLWWLSASYRTGETGRGEGRPPQGPAQPLAGDGYAASYTAVIEAQTP